jgi:heavy metal translocating P-type ATPase
MNPSAAPSNCDYCGLPLAAGFLARSAQQARVESERSVGAGHYCCFGCRFAASVAAEGGEEGHNRWTLTRLGIAIFFSMNVMVLTMALWSRDVYADEPSVQTPMALAMYELLRYGCLLFSCPVLLLLGQPIVEQSWRSLRQGRITMDWLLVAGVAASFGYSTIALVTGDPHVYFEVGCMVLLAVTLGRWLEATGKLRTTRAVRALQRLLPATTRVRTGASQFEERPLEQVQPGEVIRVLPGERIPLDGTIEANRALVDQQLVTGESEPVAREKGDPVFAGSLNLDGDLLVRVDAPASAGTLQRLVELVTSALASKGVEQRLADRLTAWFVPLVALLSVGTLVLTAQRQGWHAGLMAALAVLLIACPCALGIATPMAFWAALGAACREQVLFRSGDALSALAQIKAICLDKTGTITDGRVVVDSWLLDEGVDVMEFTRVAATIAAASTHPLSRAIVERLSTSPACDTRWPIPAMESVAGRGIIANWPATDPARTGDEKWPREACLGSLALMRQRGLVVADSLVAASHEAGQSLVFVGWNGRVRGVYRFRESTRVDAVEAIARLRELGIRVTVLTGDHSARGEQLSRELGVDVQAGLLPEGKLEALQACRGQWGRTAMVGDGINDAPALAAADVGIAMGCGADVSRDAADVCLLGNQLARIPWAIEWARTTRRTVRQNLFWAFAYNGVGVTLALAGWLNPIVAAVAMVGSSLFVISNSLALAASGSRAGSIDAKAADAMAETLHAPRGARDAVHDEATRDARQTTSVSVDVPASDHRLSPELVELPR